MNLHEQLRTISALSTRWLLFFTLCFITGCSSLMGAKSDIQWEESKPEPAWVKSAKKDATFFYYHGSAMRAKTLELGEKAARQNAYSQIAEYLGTNLESVYEGVTTDYDQDLKDSIKAKSAALINNAEVIDSYHKKMTRIDDGFQLERYDVHVLVRYLKSEAKKEHQRQEKEISHNLEAAVALYQKGQTAIAQGNSVQAKKLSSEALQILTKIPGTRPLGKGNISNNRELESLLQTLEKDAITNLRRIVVWVQEQTSGRSGSPLATQLKAQLNKKGFTVLERRLLGTSASKASINSAFNGDKNILKALQEHRSQYLVVGRASTAFSATTMNQHFFDAKGTIKLFRAPSTDVIFSIPLNTRGHHRDRARAGSAALEEAGKTAGKILVKKLLELEKN